MIAVRLTKTGRVVWLDTLHEARIFADVLEGRIIGDHDEDDA